MMKVLLTFIAAVIFLLPASAQHGTASNGYYPANYHGDTFKGEVTEANGDQITLTHRKGKKQLRSWGHLRGPVTCPRRTGARKG